MPYKTDNGRLWLALRKHKKEYKRAWSGLLNKLIKSDCDCSRSPCPLPGQRTERNEEVNMLISLSVNAVRQNNGNALHTHIKHNFVFEMASERVSDKTRAELPESGGRAPIAWN